MNEIEELQAAAVAASNAFLDANQAVNKARDDFSVAAHDLGAARDALSAANNAFSAADNAMVDAVANRNSVRTRMYSVGRALDRALALN